MFQVGDLVVYGMHGVCRVVEEEKRVIDRKKLTYLALEPVGQSGSRYLVPTHNAGAMAKLSPLLSPGELEELLLSSQVRQDGWITDESQRKQLYRELISSGQREKLLQMIVTLYRHKERQRQAGRKCHMCDENFLRDAEKLMTGEVSVILDLDPQQARSYLRDKLQDTAAV